MKIKKKLITSEVITAYSQCPRKAYLLLVTSNRGIPNEYMRIINQKSKKVEAQYIHELQASHIDIEFYLSQKHHWKSSYIIGVSLQHERYYIHRCILKKVDGESLFGNYSYEPIIFCQNYTIDKPQRINLCFVIHVLTYIQQSLPKYGHIIGLDGKVHKLSLKNEKKQLVPLLEYIQEFENKVSSENPPLILNKHCQFCQYENACYEKAEREDHLSLLDSISTKKVLEKYQKKGIFSVKQLSYLFRPRRQKKQRSLVVRHRVELQALAIRTNKIYIQEIPNLTRHSAELFLDIEGNPTEQSYYIIGLLIRDKNSRVYFNYWANTINDEEKIWYLFLEKAAEFPDSPIYHYGNYEAKAIEKLGKRYERSYSSVNERLINVNTYIYGKVYFPVRSNSLKDIGRYIGATWTVPKASGLKSLVWRHFWEETGDAIHRDTLLTYNKEDCDALRKLVDKLTTIQQSADIAPEIDFAAKPKKIYTPTGERVHLKFDQILKFAHANYDQKKIKFSEIDSLKEKQKNRKSASHSLSYRNIRRHITRHRDIPPRKFCPHCKNALLRPTQLKIHQIYIDLIRTKNGMRKSVTKYTSTKGWCPECGYHYRPEKMRTFGRPHLYGHGFKSWIVYQRVGLRMPYKAILEIIDEQFNYRLSVGSISHFIREFGEYYTKLGQTMLKIILTSPYIHVDETSINLRGIKNYIWVFTNGKYVVFKHAETRESAIVHELLDQYKGVLISDFYPGFDSLLCRQQKCWVHLIRDLNDDLWRSPFDVQYETFIAEVRDIIVPIMKAIQRYGLKSWHLNKFRKSVDQFYAKVIENRYYKSELVSKYQKRFQRYRENLFVFLEQDGIPWHNNVAENALRHITIQEKISGFYFKTLIEEYVLMLGIRQTCRFYGKSFYKFLYSKETSVDYFN